VDPATTKVLMGFASSIFGKKDGGEGGGGGPGQKLLGGAEKAGEAAMKAAEVAAPKTPTQSLAQPVPMSALLKSYGLGG